MAVSAGASTTGGTASDAPGVAHSAAGTITSVDQHLVARDQLTESDLNRAARLHRETGQSTASLLVKLGLVSEQVLASAYQEIYGLTAVSEADLPIVPVRPEQLSLRFLRAHGVVPLLEDESTLVVAMAEPDDDYVIHALELASGKQITPRVAPYTLIDNALGRLYADTGTPAASLADELADVETDWVSDDIEKLKDLASEAPVVRLVNLLIQRAIERGASDVHFEPARNGLRVRYRIDGILQDAEMPSVRSPAAVISRIKLMAKLNIAERRLPQDGRIRIQNQGREIDLRISTLPAVHGESVVLRILDKERVVLDFRQLGFEGKAAERFIDVLSLPHGILLVTGPTGSGKTTTLYSALHHLNTPDKKIVSVEDPVEYQLEDVTQIHVKPSIGLTFANTLRSIVRHDPDIIMIGEMRDQETAAIAVQSALTGHLVLSTLHTNDAGSAVTRLLDMGVEDYLLASTINGIVAQRLVRKLCDQCRQPFIPPADLLRKVGMQDHPDSEPRSVYRPVGCGACLNTGYRGRTVILEFMPMSDTIRRLMTSNTDGTAIQRAAIEEGMQPLRNHGIDKVLEGITTIDEVIRVTQET